MKRLMILSLCLLMMASFAGCGSHTYFDTWSADLNQHWHDCMDCDDEQDRGDHELNEEGYCAVCGAYVYANEDGSANVITFDNYGSMLTNAEYDAEGQLYYLQRFENAYYEDGNLKLMKEYVYDSAFDEPGVERMVTEQEFQPCENTDNGEVYCSTTISYDESGKSVMTYDEGGLAISLETYDTEDNLIMEETYEYIYDNNDNMINQKTYTNGTLSSENPQTFDAEGNLIGYAFIYYNEDGSVKETNKYDGEGNEIE